MKEPTAAIEAKRYLPIYRAERLTAVEILSEGKTAARVDELVDNAAAWAEDMIGEISALAPHDKPLACRDGCSWCCYIRVGVSEAETARIVSYLRTEFPAEAVEAIRLRAHAAAEDALGLNSDEHFAARIPCPLLQGDRCIAHEARPLACRGYNSDDASLCKHAWDERDPTLAIRCYMPQLQTTNTVALGLAQGVRDAGLHSSALELSAALTVALDRPAAVERWLAGRHPFAPAVASESQAVLEASLAGAAKDD